MSSPVTDSAASSTTPKPRPFSVRRFAIFAAIAAVANAVVFFIGSAAGGQMIVTQPSENSITVIVAIVATVVPLAIGGLVVWLLARRWPKIRTIAAWVGLAVAVISAPSPLFVSSDVTTGIALGAMHAIAGIAWFFGLRKPAAQ